MQELRNQLKKVIQDLYGIDFDPDLTPSPDNIDADYSSNAPLKLAKDLHKSPMEIADEITNEIETFISDKGGFRSAAARGLAREPRGDGSERRDPVLDINVSNPGFLNYTLSDEYLSDAIDSIHRDFTASIANDTFEGQTVICEFSDPNPFKVLHVGHLYTSIVGDSISRLFEYAGAKVIRANFGGDVGLHVAKTMYVLLKQDNTNLHIEDIAKCYIEGTALYEDDEKARQEITELNKEIYRINAEDSHNTELAELYWRGRELSYQYFKDFYATIGVHFDKYYPESTVASLGLAKVKEQLEKGVYEMSDGAVIFNGEQYGLHTRVFINKEGVPTYEAKDVGLIFTKWQDYHFDKSVVITGGEQKDYMAVVLRSVEQYAPELVERTTHLTHGLVKLPGGVKMSSRKGNFLKAVDVLDMVQDALKKEYDSDDETVSLAATKYAFLKYKMGGNIIFDPHESVKMTGNSGPYLLYSAVRAKKILDKVHREVQLSANDAVSRGTQSFAIGGFRSAAARGLAREPRGDGSERRDPNVNDCAPFGQPRSKMKKTNSSERNLEKKILEYKQVLGDAVSEMAPHKVANFLYELAQAFSRFYENCPVVGDERERERIKLVQVYFDTMCHGLNLLGITIPEEM